MSDAEAEIYRRLAGELLREAATTDDTEERARLSYEALTWQTMAADAGPAWSSPSTGCPSCG